MWLHVTGLSTTVQPTTLAVQPTKTPSEWCFDPFVTISVCVCAVMLLIGGFGLMMYKLRHKTTQGKHTQTHKILQICS
ncbi:polymeric immunoglobulin receptor-like [Clarias magur]|nr:polymeric immunoglobulin receptor-like [Clarias magur]